MSQQTIKSTALKLMQRKRPLTYQQIEDAIREKFPDAQTSAKSLAWYASQARKEGIEVNVKRADRTH